MKHLIPLVAAACLALAACASPEHRAERAKVQLEADRAECTTLGFEDGTPAFSDCLLRLREIRAEDARAQARAASRSYFGHYGLGFGPHRSLHHGFGGHYIRPYRYRHY